MKKNNTELFPEHRKKKKFCCFLFQQKYYNNLLFSFFSWYIAVGTFEIKCQNKFGAYLSGAIKSDVVMLQYCLTLFYCWFSILGVTQSNSMFEEKKVN